MGGQTAIEGPWFRGGDDGNPAAVIRKRETGAARASCAVAGSTPALADHLPALLERLRVVLRVPSRALRELPADVASMIVERCRVAPLVGLAVLLALVVVQSALLADLVGVTARLVLGDRPFLW